MRGVRFLTGQLMGLILNASRRQNWESGGNSRGVTNDRDYKESNLKNI